jgi:competence protein ComEA
VVVAWSFSGRARAALALAALLVAARPAEAGKGVDGVINLNTAAPDVLGLLPGIGPAKAAQIVAYRKRRPFRTVDELVRIKGIGRKMVRAMRVHLAVAGPTTARATVGGPAAPTVASPPPVTKPAGAPAAAHPPIRFCAKPVPPRRERIPRRPTHGACAPPA